MGRGWGPGSRGWERIGGPQTAGEGKVPWGRAGRAGGAAPCPGLCALSCEEGDGAVCDRGRGAPAMVSLSLPHCCRTAPAGSAWLWAPGQSQWSWSGESGHKRGTCFFPKPFGLLLERGHIRSCPGCGGASAAIQGINSCWTAPSCLLSPAIASH